MKTRHRRGHSFVDSDIVYTRGSKLQLVCRLTSSKGEWPAKRAILSSAISNIDYLFDLTWLQSPDLRQGPRQLSDRR